MPNTSNRMIMGREHRSQRTAAAAARSLRSARFPVSVAALAFLLGCAGYPDNLPNTSADAPLRVSTGTPTAATSPGLGRSPSPEALQQAQIRIAPDGSDLPAGRGTAVEGESVYLTHCIRCHGLGGTGKPADRLVGGVGSLAQPRPIKTVGSFWPRATVIFDYVRRAMPYDRPGSLTNTEVYAVTAYLLAENQIIEEKTEMNAITLPEVEMPNRNGFLRAGKKRTEDERN